MTLAEIRARYPVLERFAYLNAGTFGPLARRTLDAAAEQQRAEGERGRAGKEYFERMLGLRDSVRAKLAAAIGVDAARVALTTSTTDGANVVARGLRLGPGDEVVTTDAEHFGLLGGLIASGARLRVARVRERPAGEALEAILGEVGDRTRLVALSHVSWVTGHVLPLDEVKEETGLPLLVDGAQSAGAIAVDASGYDYYTISGQKWLCGPDSTGALFVADPESLALTAPSYFSQAEYDLDAPSFEPHPDARRFDTGWVPTPSLAGLDAALDELPEDRFERARAAAARCRDLLAERYEVVTEPGHATLVSFLPHGDAEEAAARAYERGVVVRDLPTTGALRVSCGFWTSDEDLERLVAALD